MGSRVKHFRKKNTRGEKTPFMLEYGIRRLISKQLALLSNFEQLDPAFAHPVTPSDVAQPVGNGEGKFEKNGSWGEFKL